MRHPLMGAGLGALLRAYRRAGPLPPGSWPLCGVFVLSAVGRRPFSWWERALHARRRARAPAIESPVFVIGHWRTGTTHLHNLMAQDPRFGSISPLAAGLPENVSTLASWLRPWLERALPEDRSVDRVAVTPSSPQEDEIPLANLQLHSVFHAVYFPLRFRELYDQGVFFDGVPESEVARWRRKHVEFLEKVAIQQGRSLLLVKNPVYTGRIELLRSIWPGARFVHVYRDPYVVYQSTLRYYRKLLSDLALQPFDHVDLEQFVLESYARLMARYDAQSEVLPPGRIAEVRYEDLVRDPLPVLERVYDTLGLADFASLRPRFRAYLESIRSYRTNSYGPLDPSAAERVDAWWGRYVDRWGYRRESRPRETPPGRARLGGVERST